MRRPLCVAAERHIRAVRYCQTRALSQQQQLVPRPRGLEEPHDHPTELSYVRSHTTVVVVIRFHRQVLFSSVQGFQASCLQLIYDEATSGVHARAIRQQLLHEPPGAC